MKITFLGTGTSIGVPCIGCTCETCMSQDPRDKRLRASALVETDEGLRILIDCGPDFRQQIMPHFGKLDAVLITHIHYDHVGGMDDLRPFGMFGGVVDVYAQKDVIDALHSTLPYCFRENLYPGVPRLQLHEVMAGREIRIQRTHSLSVKFPPSGSSLQGVMNREGVKVEVPAVRGEAVVMPIRVMHGNMPILGYRIGKLAYITDMKSMTPEDIEQLAGVELLVINALRFEKEHHSHQLVDDAVAVAQSLGVKRTYITHVTHDIGTHTMANTRLPDGVEFAYDGLTVSV